MRVSLGTVSEGSMDQPSPTNNVFPVNWAEVSAVKTCGCAAEEEQLTQAKGAAALPMRQGSPSAVYFRGLCHKSTANKHMGPAPADPITADRCHKLQQIG